MVQVETGRIESRRPTQLARGLLDLRNVAEFPTRRELGHRRRLAAIHSISLRHREMRAQLVIKVFVPATERPPHVVTSRGPRGIQIAND